MTLRQASRRTSPGPAVRGLLGERRATVAVEFALVALPLFLVSFAAIDLGLVMWTRNALAAVAADAARCGAIQGSACSGSNTIDGFVHSNAATWVLGSVVSNVNNPLTVVVNGTNNAVCPSITTGNYETVEIKTSYLAAGWLPPPFGNYTLDVCAAFAKAGS